MPCPRTALALLLLCSLAPAQDAIVRVHDLDALTAPLPGVLRIFESKRYMAFPDRSVLPHEAQDLDVLTDGGFVRAIPTPTPVLSSDDVAQWLERFWEDEAGAEAEMVGTKLVLRASPTAHGRVQELLQLLTAVVHQRLELTVAVLPRGAVSGRSAVLDATEVTALLAEHPPLRLAATEMLADVPLLLETGRAVHYLRDYDVETAEKASIGDPKMDVFFAGDRIGLVATPLADGRLMVRGGCSASRVDELRQTTFRDKGLGAVQLPTVSLRTARGAAVLPAGGGLLLGGEDAAEGVFLIQIRRSRPPVLELGISAALPLGPLAVPPLTLPPTFLRVVRPGDDSGLFGSDDGGKEQKPLAMLDLLLGRDLSEADSQVRVVGSHALFVGEAALRERARKVLVRQAEALRTRSLSWRLGSVPREDAANHLAGHASVAELTGQLSIQGIAPVLPGQAFASLCGRQESFVRDFEVEISQSAKAANPVVDIAFYGWEVRGTLREGPAGELVCTCRLIWSQGQPTPPFDTGNEAFGEIDRPTIAVADAEVRVAMAPGQWRVVHVQADPVRPETHSLVLALKLD